MGIANEGRYRQVLAAAALDFERAAMLRDRLRAATFIQGSQAINAEGLGSADVFAHFSAIASGGYRSLEENQKVEFETARGPKGLQAENITVIG